MRATPSANRLAKEWETTWAIPSGNQLAEGLETMQATLWMNRLEHLLGHSPEYPSEYSSDVLLRVLFVGFFV